ncbi:MAG: DUF58 domain-containing protein [Phycisphaerales bacterium]|jgi:uncharacterized protein (DUF58 family)|nr:DUF58 domain-containing protein [Phycisphaerales bacterium]
MQTQHPELVPPDELARGDFEMVVRRLADDLAFGTDASLFTGSGLEYAQSRKYEPGDSIKQIDWRLTARSPGTWVKEYEALKRTAVYLVLDTSASMAVSSSPLSKHDLAVWIAAAVGLIAQRRLSPCAVIGAGERSPRFQPSLIRTDLWRSLEPMRRLDHGEPTNLGGRLEKLTTRAGRSSVIVILSDLHDPGALPAIRHAAQRHDVIVMELRDPAEFGRLSAGYFRGREAETGRHFLGHGRSHWQTEKQDDVGRMLARCGASWLRLVTDQPFMPPLRHFLARRASTARGRT